jgi:hypothetical protein
MCKSNDSSNENIETTMTNEGAAAAANESPSSSSSDDETKTQPASAAEERFSWWRGAGIKPNSGKDLGIFESSLEDRANCLSLWSLSYLNPLLGLGSRKVLDAGDVGVPSGQDRAERAYNGTMEAWLEQVEKTTLQNESLRTTYKEALARCTTDEQKEKVKEPTWKEPSIASSLMKSFGLFQITLAIVYYVISALLAFVPVLILNNLVTYFQHYSRFGDEVPFEDAIADPWILVAMLGVIPAINSSLQTRHQAIMAHCGVFVRTAVSAMLYQKSLKVSAAGRAKTSTGQVVNMMSNDTMQLQRFLQFIGMTMVAPIQIVVALYLIFQEVSVSVVLLSGRYKDECHLSTIYQSSVAHPFVCSFYLLITITLLTGWKCHLGRCCLHGRLGSHQHDGLLCRFQNETQGPQILRSPRQNDE